MPEVQKVTQNIFTFYLPAVVSPFFCLSVRKSFFYVRLKVTFRDQGSFVQSGSLYPFISGEHHDSVMDAMQSFPSHHSHHWHNCCDMHGRRWDPFLLLSATWVQYRPLLMCIIAHWSQINVQSFILSPTFLYCWAAFMWVCMCLFYTSFRGINVWWLRFCFRVHLLLKS